MNAEHQTSLLREFLRDPFTVVAVAVAPSGTRLADLITATVPRTGGPVVVELGPGIGRTVWVNMPPAFVYSGRRPRVPARPRALALA